MITWYRRKYPSNKTTLWFVKIWLPQFQILFMTWVKFLNVSEVLHRLLLLLFFSIDSLKMMRHASTSRTRTITTDNFFFPIKQLHDLSFPSSYIFIPWFYPSINIYFTNKNNVFKKEKKRKNVWTFFLEFFLTSFFVVFLWQIKYLFQNISFKF